MKYDVPIRKEKEIDIPFDVLRDDVREDVKDAYNISNPDIETIVRDFRHDAEFYLNRILNDDEIIYSDDWIDDVTDEFRDYLYGM